MIRKINENNQGSELISELVVHEESLLEAELSKEGIIVAKTSNYRGLFLLDCSDLEETLGFFDEWDKYSLTLPGFAYLGNPMGRIVSVSYYPPNSDEEKLVIGGEEVSKYMNSPDYKRLKLGMLRAQAELSTAREKYLSKGELRAYISRFELTLEEYVIDECGTFFPEDLILNKTEMGGIREIVQLYNNKEYK